MSIARSPIITVMTKAARRAARGLIHDFREVEQLQVSVKGTNDFVSEADLRAEKVIKEELMHARPKFGYLMEESGEMQGEENEYRWVVDPIDGTNNFLHAIPYFCISIAQEKRKYDGTWEVVAGLIYDPIHDDLFACERGNGAFHNDRRMAVSKRSDIQNSLFVTAAARYGRDGNAEALRLHNRVAERTLGVRTMGATALDLAYVAAGRFDGAWYKSFRHWDIAAGILMVKEAGGVVTQIGGDSNLDAARSLVAANERIHQNLDALLRENC